EVRHGALVMELRQLVDRGLDGDRIARFEQPSQARGSQREAGGPDEVDGGDSHRRLCLSLAGPGGQLVDGLLRFFSKDRLAGSALLELRSGYLLCCSWNF